MINGQQQPNLCVSDGADGKVEEKKKEGSPMRSSSTCKDSGEKR